MMAKQKRKNDETRPRSLIIGVLIQFAIFPVLGITAFFYLLEYFAASGVCGSGPMMLTVNRPLICDADGFIMTDLVLGSVSCFVLWIGLHETKYRFWGRVAILLYLFVGRYLLIRLAATVVVGA